MKKRKITKETVTIKTAVAWYKLNQWPRLREISEDRDRLEETYGEWQLYAEQALKDFVAKGGYPEKVTVDTEELLFWCKERGLKVDGDSRSRYAAWLLMEKDKGKRKSDG